MSHGRLVTRKIDHKLLRNFGLLLEWQGDGEVKKRMRRRKWEGTEGREGRE